MVLAGVAGGLIGLIAARLAGIIFNPLDDVILQVALRRSWAHRGFHPRPGSEADHDRTDGRGRIRAIERARMRERLEQPRRPQRQSPVCPGACHQTVKNRLWNSEWLTGSAPREPTRARRPRARGQGDQAGNPSPEGTELLLPPEQQAGGVGEPVSTETSLAVTLAGLQIHPRALQRQKGDGEIIFRLWTTYAARASSSQRHARHGYTRAALLPSACVDCTRGGVGTMQAAADQVAKCSRVMTARRPVAGQDPEERHRKPYAFECRRRLATRSWRSSATSGAKGRNPAAKVTAVRRRFDMVAVWAVDRLGRSLTDLLNTLQTLKQSKVGLFLHQQGIDTSTAAGNAFFQMLGVLAVVRPGHYRRAGQRRNRPAPRRMGRSRARRSALPRAEDQEAGRGPCGARRGSQHPRGGAGGWHQRRFRSGTEEGDGGPISPVSSRFPLKGGWSPSRCGREGASRILRVVTTRRLNSPCSCLAAIRRAMLSR